MGFEIRITTRKIKGEPEEVCPIIDNAYENDIKGNQTLA